MRLAAQAKMGYYPTPDRVISLIANYLKRKNEGLIKILDPCAGEGTALKLIGDHLKAETYGIEIDHERGNKAKEILTKCLVTDHHNTRISHGSFSLLWLNPPYDWSTRDSDIEKSERYERTFLRDCIPYLCPKGVLAYLIPQNRLDSHISRMLAYRFEKISVFRFPEQEYGAFKQLVIIGILKTKPDKDERTAQYLKNCGQIKVVLPHLPEDPPHIYEVPLSSPKANFIFRSKAIDPEELAIEIEQHGLFSQFMEMITPLQMAEKIRPILPLRHGHLAQILACGLMNGVVWDRDKINPLVIKGVTRKEVRHSVEAVGENIEKHIETDQIKIIINAFDRNGKMFTIQ